MRKIRYRLVYNRGKKLNKQGKALVQVEALLNRKKMYTSTDVYLRPSEWDSTCAQVAETHPNHKDLNIFLAEFIFELERAELSIRRRGMEPTLLMLKESIREGNRCDVSFAAFARKSIEQSDRRKRSKDNLYATLALLDQYAKGYDWGDLTYPFVRGLEVWLRDKGKSTNTIAKHLTNLRTLINEAVRMGYTSDANPFDLYRIHSEKGQSSFLTVEELSAMERLEPDKPALRHVLDAFLYCCYTGLRYSDFVSLKSEHLVMHDGHMWMEKNSVKTGAELMLPLWLLGGGKAMHIMQAYPNIETFAKIGCNPDVNRKLKILTDRAGIRKRITFHSARHTCATTLVYYGTPITTVQKVLGHSKISTTQIYSDVHQQTLVRDLSRLSTSF